MRIETQKGSCGPGFPKCPCCRRTTVKDAKRVTVRFRRRQDKKAVAADDS